MASDYSMSELLDLAVEELQPLRKRAMKRRLSNPRFRNAMLDDLCIYCCDCPQCAELLGEQVASGLMAGSISATQRFAIDPEKLRAILDLIIEYLPKLLAIILPLFA